MCGYAGVANKQASRPVSLRVMSRHALNETLNGTNCSVANLAELPRILNRLATVFLFSEKRLATNLVTFPALMWYFYLSLVVGSYVDHKARLKKQS